MRGMGFGQDKRAKRGASDALVASRAFAAGMGLWGALLGALVVMVLPPALAFSFPPATAIARLGLAVQPTLAGGAAMGLGALCFALAAVVSAAVRRRSGRRLDAGTDTHEVDPIDPLHDLGLADLDEVEDPVPFATRAWHDADEDAPAPAATSDGEGEDVRRTAMPPSALPGTAALTLLRSIPTSELSMPEMVERLAAALHEHRGGPPLSAPAASDLAQREAALAEALKALAALSEGTGTETHAARGAEAMRQGLRGV